MLKIADLQFHNALCACRCAIIREQRLCETEHKMTCLLVLLTLGQRGHSVCAGLPAHLAGSVASGKVWQHDVRARHHVMLPYLSNRHYEKYILLFPPPYSQGMAAVIACHTQIDA